jgi:hypothetical protein
MNPNRPAMKFHKEQWPYRRERNGSERLAEFTKSRSAERLLSERQSA